MTRRLRWSIALLTLATGTTLALSYGGCLSTTVQRIVVGAAFE